MPTTTVSRTEPTFPWAQKSFADWLFSSLYQKSDGGWGMADLPAYPGPVSPDINQTILPNIWGSFDPRGGVGQDFLSNYLQSGAWMMTPQIADKMNNLFQYGGPGGYGTDLMHTMAEYGGVGNPAKAMSMAWQYGAPSQAGQPIGLTSQFGGYGDWGKALQSRAAGTGGGALQFLAPFLQRGAGWQAPTMPQQGGR